MKFLQQNPFLVSRLKAVFIRFYCQNALNQVRVRFAPSPTGFLHLGGLRTVVLNYLFARANNGVFVLRIEDTDRKRLKEGSVENLLDILNWFGMKPDEGVGAISNDKNGGPYGPYYQSQRLDLYRKYAEDLVEKGFAYRCFCTEDRLMMLRNEALKNRQPVQYDGKCRHLKEAEILEKLETQISHVIRFKYDAKPFHFDDIVFGRVDFEAGHESDFVLLKSDQYPTYHLANVVDDKLMQISHVMRGEEWLISTRKHARLYDAFGWPMPLFIHLPLMMGKGGMKLSKRDNDVFVQSYRDKGYFPLALINFVTSTGKGFRNREKDQIYSIDELAQMLDIKLISRQATQFEPEWLDALNHKMIMERVSNQEMIQKVQIMLRQKNISNRIGASFDIVNNEVYIERCLLYAKNRIKTLQHLFEKDLACLWSVPDPECSLLKEKYAEKMDKVSEIVIGVKERLETFDSDWTVENIAQLLNQICQDEKWPKSLVFHCLRVALCGCLQGPPVAEIFDLLGRKIVINRLSFVIDKVCAKDDDIETLKQ